MSVRENLAYALPDQEEGTIVEDMLTTLDLTALAEKKPYQLSGGQQQRVALGRAIIPKPAVLLLDEPLSALDQAFREQMQHYLLRLHQEYDFSMIIVSHDKQEIYTLAHRIAVLDRGKMSIQHNKPIQYWSTVQERGMVLEGSIIKIKKGNSSIFAHVLIGDNIVELPVKSIFKIGERVKVSFVDKKHPTVLLISQSTSVPG